MDDAVLLFYLTQVFSAFMWGIQITDVHKQMSELVSKLLLLFFIHSILISTLG